MDGGSQITGNIAPLRNVRLLSELVERGRGRNANLPGFLVFHGPSGYGKSCAAIFVANKHRAYHVQAKSVWTKKALVTDVLFEMGIRPQGTIPDMVKQIGEELALSRRPLLLDEADYLVDKKLIEVVRDIYESCFGTIVLIGEETLPRKLMAWERVHGRVLDWVGAEPATIDDAAHLARLYYPDLTVEPELLRELHAKSHSARRICVNLAQLAEAAANLGLARVGLAEWKGKFHTGEAPDPRKGVAA